jgi:hypothetical protein
VKKLKFKSAEHKRAYYEQKEAWEQLKKKYEPTRKIEAIKSDVYVAKRMSPPRGESVHYPSRDSGLGVAVKAPDKVYTGTKMIGIGTLHKSNAVPIFSDDDAKAIASMRR